MHHPLAAKILRQLLGKGRESISLNVGIVAMVGLQGPGAIGLRLDGPYGVSVGHFLVTSPGAISQTVQIAAKVPNYWEQNIEWGVSKKVTV